VDLEQKKVTGDLNTGSGPMGVVITPDGKRAFVGQYSASYLSVIDIEKRTFDMVQTGSSFNEELALDSTGTTGILSYGPAGDCVTFSVADPAGTKGNTIATTGLDAGGVAFFPGTKVAFIVQAPTDLTFQNGGHSVVDASNPQAPVVTDVVRVAGAPTQYPVTAVPYRKSIVYPQTNTSTSKLSLREMKLEGETAVEVQNVPVGDADNLAYGVSFDPVGKVVLLAVPGNHFIATVDLETKKVIKVPMDFTASGPTTIRVVP
jgi:DNA-binding beta-propeller fold protein YncE